MGIPAYFSHIIKNHSDLLNKKINNIDHLLLDSNSIIYDNINNDDNIIIKNVCKKLEYYIKFIKPTKSVYIAFDGIAPLAKLKQQRERRYKNCFIKSLLKQSGWNTASITPGTTFMKKLSREIIKYFEQINNINIIISTSESRGEGEHKLCEYIRTNKSIKGSNILIYGLDADLIMLALTHINYCKNIYLYRETPEFIKQINSHLDDMETYYLNIGKFKEKILRLMNNNYTAKTYQKNRLYDYIFLCFLLGNDFLPHFPALNLRTNGMNNILLAYNETIKSTNKSIIYRNEIQWHIFKKFLLYLVKYENTFICKEYKKKENKVIKIRTKDKEYNLNLIPQLLRETEMIIDPFNNNWTKRYYQELFYIEYNKTNISIISNNYLEGLEWTWKYYTIGCQNWRWKYNYNYPPLLEDLYDYIPNKSTLLIQKNDKNITALVQLAYVLPKEYINLIPKKYHRILKQQNFYDIISFDWSFCKYFWESNINLIEIDIDNLEQLMKE